MKKIIFMFVVSLFVFLEDGVSLQKLLNVGVDGLHGVPRYSSRSQRRFFSSTYQNDQVPTLERNKKVQVFSCPTSNRLAKYLLSENEAVRIDILRALTGVSTLSSAIQLVGHYHPFDPLHNLRKLINSHSSQHLFEMIKNSSTLEISIDRKENQQASEILNRFSKEVCLYNELSHAFPDFNRSTVDFLCETDCGYITIVFHLTKQNNWNRKALAHIASLYGNQLKSKQDYYYQLQDVIGVSLLGDGSDPYWRDGDFMRDYTFINQREIKHKIPSLRLIQYSLGDVDLNHKDLRENDHLRQWIEFFKSAHEKESIPPSIDENVRKAYDMIRFDTLKKQRPDLLEDVEQASGSIDYDLGEHDQVVLSQGNPQADKKG